MVKSKKISKKPARESPKKQWCFTLNNPTIPKETLLEQLKGFCDYIVIGDEVGINGTPHFQGYMDITKKRRLNSVLLLFAPFKPHLEPKSPHSTPFQAAEYCKKDAKYVESGISPKAGQKKNPSKSLNLMCEALKTGSNLEEAMAIDPATYVRNYRGLQEYQSRLIKVPNMRPMECYFFYGPTGVGKSHYVFDKWPDLYRKAIGKCLWMDGLEPYHKVIFFDEFVGQYPRADLLMITDKYPCRVEVKGGYRQLCSELMVFASNKHPSTFYDAWKGNEEHLRALARRFTKVFWWPTRRRDSLLILEQPQEVEEWFLDEDNTRKIFGDN